MDLEEIGYLPVDLFDLRRLDECLTILCGRKIALV